MALALATVGSGFGVSPMSESVGCQGGYAPYVRLKGLWPIALTCFRISLVACFVVMPPTERESTLTPGRITSRYFEKTYVVYVALKITDIAARNTAYASGA